MMGGIKILFFFNIALGFSAVFCSTYYCVNQARKKKRSRSFWGIFGFLFPIISPIWIFCLKSKNPLLTRKGLKDILILLSVISILPAQILLNAGFFLYANTQLALIPVHTEKNIDTEKKQNILKSLGINISKEQVEIVYYDYIKEELVIDNQGKEKEGVPAFGVDLSEELEKDASEQDLPLYIAEVDRERKYIVPLRGKGLWGPIWGFISLNDDFNTIYGIVFDHKKETPGLGAEINTTEFQNQFKTKLIYENGNVRFEIKKNTNGGVYEVDAVSGGTITSDGVTDMITERMEKYLPYFDKLEK